MLTDPLYRILAGMLAFVLLIGAFEATYWVGHHNGAKAQEAVYAAQQVKARDAVHVVESKGNQVTQQVRSDVVAKQTEIKWRTQYLTKEVVQYVTPEADAKCVVPTGFVSVYAQAVTGTGPTIPGPSGGPVDAPSGVPLSTVLETDVYNLGVGNALLAEDMAWRAWYAGQRRVYGTRAAGGPATAIAPDP